MPGLSGAGADALLAAAPGSDTDALTEAAGRPAETVAGPVPQADGDRIPAGPNPSGATTEVTGAEPDAMWGGVSGGNAGGTGRDTGGEADAGAGSTAALGTLPDWTTTLTLGMTTLGTTWGTASEGWPPPAAALDSVMVMVCTAGPGGLCTVTVVVCTDARTANVRKHVSQGTQ
jgi:hypothetical protein